MNNLFGGIVLLGKVMFMNRIEWNLKWKIIVVLLIFTLIFALCMQFI